MTLTDFLLARIAEDEARAAGLWDGGSADPDFSWGPDRIRSECAIKRRIVELHELAPYYGLDQWGRWLPREGEPKFWYCDCESNDGMIGRDGPCGTLRALASVYADHPDYDEAWRS